MKKSILPLILVYCLPGCASHCFDRDLYRPTVISDSHAKVTIEQFDLTVGAFIDLGAIASLRVSECGAEKTLDPVNPKKVCLEVRVDDSHTFQFSEAIVEVYASPGTLESRRMSDIEYRIFTSIKSDGSRESDSSFASPTDAPLKQREDRYGTGLNNYFSFEPTAAFKGARSTFAPPATRAFSSDAKRRPYSSSISLPPNLGKRFFVKLPDVRVDGKEYKLPTLEFNYARESICYTAV